ncbi:MAG TPA: hypothetical protein VFG43_15715 [Geminicoccaceae bacterium]|nr:hypothetical protein [Geminicoccaceae bacterium]
MLLAALWGFAEATLFIIVPDVALTAVALLAGWRRALLACLWAVAGALVGGALMHRWGSIDPSGAVAALTRLPAISPGMVRAVGAELADLGFPALMLGPLSGRPYKIYAVQAGAAGMGLVPFLAVSVPARLARFVLLVLLVAAIDRALASRLALRLRLALLAGAWSVFYAAYFVRMSG